MSDEVTTGPESENSGQVSLDPVTGRPEVTPEVITSGQSEEKATTETTVESGSQKDTEDSFFNPDEIKDKPELLKAYKQMQAKWTKDMQAIKESKRKIDAFDAFQADPIGQMQALAKQRGFSLTRAEAAAEIKSQNSNSDFQPETWDDVFSKMESHIQKKMEERFGPVVNQVQNMKRQTIEKMLDDNVPDWKQYEDEMMGNLQRFPEMVNDPLLLYRISVPPEILESRAAKNALKKLQDKAGSAKTSGISTAKPNNNASIPTGAMTFDQAVAYAKSKLAQEGIVRH